MRNTQKLTLALFIQAALISSTYASEQSEAKGFVEDAQGSVLFRTGFIQRDKKDGVKELDEKNLSVLVKLSGNDLKDLKSSFGNYNIRDEYFGLQREIYR